MSHSPLACEEPLDFYLNLQYAFLFKTNEPPFKEAHLP